MPFTKLKTFYRAHLPEYYGSTLVIIFFIIFLVVYLFAMIFLLERIPFLNSLMMIYSSAHFPIPGFDAVGFGIPLVAFAIALADRFGRNRSAISMKQGQRDKRYWMMASVVAILLSYFIPGLMVGGHTDAPLLGVFCIYLGSQLKSGTIRSIFFLSLSLGFSLGLISDLQSSVYFLGIFGAGGWIDGDFMETFLLPLATLASFGIVKRLRLQTPSSLIISH